MSSHGFSLPRTPIIPLAALAGLGLWAWSQRLVKTPPPAGGDVKTGPADLLSSAPRVGRRFYVMDGGCSGTSPATGTLKSIAGRESVFVRAIPAAERTRLAGFGYQVGGAAFVDETGKLFVYVQHYPDYLYVPFSCLTTIAPPAREPTPPADPAALPKLYTRVCTGTGCSLYREPQDVGEGPAVVFLKPGTMVDVVAVQGNGSTQIRYTAADGTRQLAWVRNSDLESPVVGIVRCAFGGGCRVYVSYRDAEANQATAGYFIAQATDRLEVLEMEPPRDATDAALQKKYLRVRLRQPDVAALIGYLPAASVKPV